jgi:tRNA U34 2-thiouridine synthase MnmA/TrmU
VQPVSPSDSSSGSQRLNDTIREVKFGALMQHLYSNDTWLATGSWAMDDWAHDRLTPYTGHYARKGLSTEPTLLRARDTNKDQSYYLAAMPQSSLARTLFPIGDLTKVEVRALAEKYNLPTAARPESMGICFIGEKRKFSDFIGEMLS